MKGIKRFSIVRENLADMFRRYKWILREPDAVIVYLYWRVYDTPRLDIDLPFIPTGKLRLLTNPETILRRRRELGVWRV